MKESTRNCLLILLGVLVGAFILHLLFRKGCKDTYLSPRGYADVPEDRQFLPLPGAQPTYGYWQNLPPSLRVENDYHHCMGQECGGDYQDYKCRQKCYLKTMKDGTTDRADLICSRYQDNEDAYYTCLDTVYGRSIGMDRSVGTADTCNCGHDNGIRLTGIIREDGSCLCPPKTPLSDRRLRDEDWRPVGPSAINQNSVNN